MHRSRWFSAAKLWRDGDSVTTRRPSDFDLRRAAASPSFTPRRDDLEALLDLLDDDDAEADVERAILRLGPGAVPDLAAAARAAAGPRRARIVRVLGRAAGDAAPLLPFLDDADAKTRRNAAIALGRHRDAEAPLLAHLRRDLSPPERRSTVESLGKIGGPAALAALSTLPGGDAELDRIAARARLRLERTSLRGTGGSIAADVGPAAPLAVRALSRAGLEELLAGELAGRVLGPGAVAATLDGPLPRLFRARTMLRFGFPIAGAPADALASDAAFAILSRFTRGPIRYRLAFARGHRRAEVLAIAAAVPARRPALVNDPKDSLWEVEIGDGEILLVPKALPDPRFDYRVRDVPASSHPTIAAAIARAAGARPDDVVWDPFCGAGAELVERARLGPVRALFGSDLSPAALAASEENLRAAGVTATLVRADARVYRPPGVSLILTNPPMGRRVPMDPALLPAFVAHAATLLPPRGRLCWISPQPQETLSAARAHGLAPRLRRTIDMGGFTAELQLLTSSLST